MMVQKGVNRKHRNLHCYVQPTLWPFFLLVSELPDSNQNYLVYQYRYSPLIDSSKKTSYSSMENWFLHKNDNHHFFSMCKNSMRGVGG